MFLFMDSDDDFTGPMNMGNPTEITIRELAETIIDISNFRSMLDEKKLPEDDPKRRRPDISLAQGKLGWEPKISLRDGLSKTIQYFDNLLHAKANKNFL
jgi:UDP-glucuronate decarboxylase